MKKITTILILMLGILGIVFAENITNETNLTQNQILNGSTEYVIDTYNETEYIKYIPNVDYENQEYSYNAQSADLTSGILAYWKLDNSYLDSTNNAHTLTPISTPSYNLIGKINGAYDFLGSSTSGFNTGLNYDLDSGISISYWAKINTLRDYNVVLGTQWGTANQYWFLMNRLDQNGWTIQCSNTGSALFRSANYGATANEWQHVVMTIDSSNIVRWYINGVAKGNGVLPCGTSNGNIYLGSFTNANTINAFDGTIDEVGIWNRALTQEEITQIYNSGSGIQHPFIVSISKDDAKTIIENTFNTNLTNPTIEYNQTIYVEYQNSTVIEENFDYFVSYQNKRYAINYGDESYNNINSIRTTFNVLQITPTTQDSLMTQIANLINNSLN